VSAHDLRVLLRVTERIAPGEPGAILDSRYLVAPGGC